MAGPFHHSRPARLLRWCLFPCWVGCALHVAAQDTSPDAAIHHLFGLDTLADDDWTRHFRLGAMVGLNIHGNFSLTGNSFPINGHDASSGNYDDGYVLTDSTGNAGGLTSYWGYDHASQYNAATGDLTMHSASAYSPLAGQGDASANAAFTAGFELAYGDSYWSWHNAKVGWEFGFGILPIELVDRSPLNVNVVNTSYVFNTGGVVPSPNPYQGTFTGIGNGGVSGPVIGTNYTKGASSVQSGILTGTRTLDTTLYTFRLGPWLYWDLNDSFGLSVGGGPALGLATSTLSYNESIAYGTGSVAQNSGSFGSTSIVYGGYVNATLVWHAPEKADLFVGVQYMPLSNVQVDGGNRRAELDLGGQVYISAGVNWPF